MPSRRDFLYASAGLALQANAQVGRPAPATDRKLRLAVIGGGFGAQFSFHEHPNCVVAAVSDLRAERRRALRDQYRCDNMYDSLEQLLDKEKRLDAVALFTPATLHHKHVSLSMNRGLNVYCAVPACHTLEEAESLAALKKRTGLGYMLGETSYFRPGCIYARQLFQSGVLGEVYYSELAYYHDRGDLQRLVDDKKSRFYEPGGSRSWRWGFPPLGYPTHSLGFLTGVTGERITSVSALGWGSHHPFLHDNVYKNPFWNESALMETDKGHMARCNVFWLVGEDGERAQWYSDKGTLYMANSGLHPDLYHAREKKPQPVKYPDYLQDPMIPPAMRHPSGHGGSHVFLSAEFINSLLENREPMVGMKEGLAITVPGLVGHESALKRGERLRVPEFL
ncbi:MAG: Gfo/Idh/MocA family oxidoreductase [Acidobacteria bacterium]|nr:Gfo/Idh/MocA family oxidoreductase [Acidobacteriota bacterium]